MKKEENNVFAFVLSVKILGLNGYDFPRVSFTLPHSCILCSSKYQNKNECLKKFHFLHMSQAIHD